MRNGLFVVTSMFFLVFRFISFRRRSKTPVEFRVGALVDSLIFDEAVQVVIDGFGRYAVVFPQMVQDGLFEGFRDDDYTIGFNKAFGRLHKDALLSDDAVGRVPWLPDLALFRRFFQQNKPAIFIVETIAGERREAM